MITSEQVKLCIDVNYELLISKYNDYSSKENLKKEKNEILDYITQQEKVNELLELYRNIWKIILQQTMSLEEAQNEIYKFESELK